MEANCLIIKDKKVLGQPAQIFFPKARKNLLFKIMPYFTYILECSDKTYYVGCTNNLEKRLKEHNRTKSGAHYTKIRRPVILKYSEKFDTLLDARKREAEIKSWKRKQKESLWSKFDEN